MVKKVISVLAEQDVVFLENPEIKFVSLVKRAANREPFKILKEEKKMSKVLLRILIPKGEKEDEILKKYADGLEVAEKKEIDNFVVVAFKNDKEVKEEDMALLDKEKGVYGIFGNIEEKDEKAEKSFKEIDPMTYDNVMDAIFSTMDIVIGTLKMPFVENEVMDRKNTIKNALSNLITFMEAVFEGGLIKQEFAHECNIDKYENLKDFFKKEEKKEDKNDKPEKKEEEFDVTQIKDEITKAINSLAEGLKESLINEVESRFNEKLEKYVDNDALEKKFEDFAKKFSEIEKTVEKIANTTARKSDIDDDFGTVSKSEVRKGDVLRFRTFA